jgi:hypothetical protein
MLKRLLPTLVVASMLAACSSGPPPPPPPPPFTPAGEFNVSIDAMGMMLGGSLATDMVTVELTNFAVNGNEVTFVGSSPDFSLAFHIAIDGDEMMGSFEIAGMGEGSISGTRR